MLSREVLTSMDIEERIEELEDERAEMLDLLENAEGNAAETEAQNNLDGWDDMNGSELDDLKEAMNLIVRSSKTLIHEDYFTKYIKDMVCDCYDLRALPEFIANNIDWDNVAEDMRPDYMDVNINGEDYYLLSF